jgi:hypothetical protein
VPVEDHGGSVDPRGGADLGQYHRETLVLAVGDFDVTGPEPALDEAGRGPQAVERRGVVGDEALG